MVYPEQVKTDQEKLHYLVLAKEHLRKEHNFKGAEYRTGQISRSTFDKYVNGRHEPKLLKIEHEIAAVTKRIKESDAYPVDLEALF